jgi:hypothetical protein
MAKNPEFRVAAWTVERLRREVASRGCVDAVCGSAEARALLGGRRRYRRFRARGGMISLGMSRFFAAWWLCSVSACVAYGRVTQLPPGSSGPSATTGVRAPTAETCVDDAGCQAPALCLRAQCVSAPPTSCGGTSRTPSGPVIFFTDLTSGPNHGGLDDLGVFVTLYGLRLGAAQGESYVTVGGGEVARYASWNPPNPADARDRFAARGLERVIVQLGPQAKTGDIVAVVSGMPSNGVAFTVREGNILLVDPAAAATGDGSFASPFKHLYEIRSPAVSSGTTVYVKSGGARINEADPAPSSPYFSHTSNLLMTLDLLAPGTEQQPVAIVGYPNDPPLIGGLPNGGLTDYAFRIADPELSHYTFANLGIERYRVGFDFSARGTRVIGCRFRAVGGQGGGVLNVRSRSQTFGNLFRTTDLLPSVSVANASTDVEVAWNEFAGDEGSVSSSFSVVDVAAARVRFHGNLIENNIYKQGAFGGQDVESVELSNNVFGATIAALFEMRNLRTGALRFLHNTHKGGLLLSLSDALEPGAIVMRNNIVTAESSKRIYAAFESGATSLAFDAAANGYDDTPAPGASPLVPEEVKAFVGNPRYSSRAAENYIPAADSPARDAAEDADGCSDYLGVARPQGAKSDVGAFERP